MGSIHPNIVKQERSQALFGSDVFSSCFHSTMSFFEVNIIILGPRPPYPPSYFSFRNSFTSAALPPPLSCPPSSPPCTPCQPTMWTNDKPIRSSISSLLVH